MRRLFAKTHSEFAAANFVLTYLLCNDQPKTSDGSLVVAAELVEPLYGGGFLICIAFAFTQCYAFVPLPL